MTWQCRIHKPLNSVPAAKITHEIIKRLVTDNPRAGTVIPTSGSTANANKTKEIKNTIMEGGFKRMQNFHCQS